MPRTVRFACLPRSWFNELIHPNALNRVKANTERVIEKGEEDWDLRYRSRAKVGFYRHWLDRDTMTAYLDGRSNEGIGTIVCKTEQVLARRERR